MFNNNFKIMVQFAEFNQPPLRKYFAAGLEASATQTGRKLLMKQEVQ
jgi:hypothetical protein